jgi:sodium/potassium/calcium exchanger 6
MTTSVECRDYRSYHNGTCHFIRTTDDCQMDDGFINYLIFVFCNIGERYVALGLTLLAVWLVILFIGLGVTADSYFCPALTVIAKVLKLSENIAGVTFLAFGNGAPDIFSAIAAVSSAKGGDVGLAFGALFGAGVFVTTVVAGTICLVTPFRSIQRPLLRDIIFFLVAAFAAYVAMYDGKIEFAESFGFIIMYIVYLIVLIGGYFINRKMKDRRATQQAAETQVAAKTYGSIQTSPQVTNHVDEETPILPNEAPISSDESTIPPDESYAQQDVSYALYLRHAFLPRDDVPWAERRIFGKMFTILKLPVNLILHYTVPLVDYEKPENNWHKILNSFHLLSGPLTVSLLTQVGFIKIRDVFPIWAVVAIVGTILCFAMLILTEYHTKPRYHSGFAFLGFAVSVVWIYSIANEIVNLLTTFGIIFGISNTILGLTFLAWGNSLSDYVADVVSARQGYPNMGMSACYGGPLLNFLMGLGLPFSYATLKSGHPFAIDKSLLQNVIAYFLFGSLAGTLAFITINKFFYSRRFGSVLIIYYISFLVVAILIETNIIGSN